MKRDTPYEDDARLLQSVADGNEKAFRAIYDRFWKVVYSTILRMIHDEAVARDLTQETFIILWKNRAGYDKVKNLKSYLYGIARNITIDALNKRLREQEILEMLKEAGQKDTTRPFDITGDEIERLLKDTVALLPEKRRKIYERVYQGTPYKDIASEFRISENDIRLNIVKANKFIRDQIIRKYRQSRVSNPIPVNGAVLPSPVANN